MSKNSGTSGNPMMDHVSDKDKTQDMTYILTKFLSRGYDSLTNEELAVTLINPDYNSVFKKQTGTDWISKYQIQSIDKLKSVNFDLNFMTSSITHEKFNAFFVAVIKGDLEAIREYFRKYSDEELLRVVDVSKKSPLHHAAREGRTSVADYLMTKGFKVNARERTLKTPLHYACLFGHAVLADLLLKRGADIVAKDCSGRTCFHFSCCSWSNEAIALVLGLKPELINLGDNIGRTGLHYAVWNSCDAQVDIIRTIIERGGNINQVDDYGKTALHYAAEGGRSRAIPILIQKGADMSIRETKTHKTPLELACNERIRELMVVYSSAPYTLKSKDKSFLDNAIKGESVVIKKQTIFNEEKTIKKPASAFVESIPTGQRGSNLVPEYWRSKMIKIMEQLQEIGVRSHQHIKRPYLFTGSWMEGVTTIEQLFDRIKGITSNEAMLRLFNILQPFEGEMPGESKDEVAVSNFYGEYYNFEVPKETRVDLSAIGNSVIEQTKIAQMNSALELANKKNEELNSKVAALIKDSQEYQKMISDLKTKNSEFESMKSQYSKLQDSIRIKESSLFDVQKQRDELERRIRDEVMGKDSTIGALQKDLQERDIELQKVKKEVTVAAAKIKLLESKTENTNSGGYGGSNMKVMNKFERKRYVAQDLTPEEVIALQALMAKIRGNPPDLATRLRAEDKNADGLMNSYEFLQAMEKLKLSPEELHALRTIAGFLKYDEVYIEDFVELINRRLSMDLQTEINLLQVFLTAFAHKRMKVRDAFKQYDLSNDTLLDIGEFRQLVNDLGINFDDKSLNELFRLLDTDRSGGISLDEFMNKLSALESEINSKNPTMAKELEDKQKDKTKPKEAGPKLKNVMKKLEAVDIFDNIKDKNRDKMETIDEAERLKGILEKGAKGSEFIKNNDFEPLVGEIKIQFQKLEKIQINTTDFKTFFLLIRLPGITKNWIEKEIYTHGLSAFKYAMRISVINVLEENIGKTVMIKLVGLNKQDLRADLGGCEVAWKKGLEIPNEWVINNSYTFEGGCRRL